MGRELIPGGNPVAPPPPGGNTDRYITDKINALLEPVSGGRDRVWL